MGAPDPLASMTSLSLMAPAPDRMMRARTSSVASFSREPTMASADPWTSALMMTGISEIFLSCILAMKSAMDTPPATGAPAFSRFTRMR